MALRDAAEHGIVLDWNKDPNRIRKEQNDASLPFCVWNEKTIPQEITQRIFRHNVNTKEHEDGESKHVQRSFSERKIWKER